ncbi:MAG: hypothetical protein DRI65_08520 [Chloroflexota bacterium]|nr:MAG: hypothetical protein DRI65_08520 [Chloroflexota bacterium]
MQWRNIKDNGRQSTIALENSTWKLIDCVSKSSWQEWVAHKLKSRPAGATKAGWLRSAAIDECNKLLVH